MDKKCEKRTNVPGGGCSEHVENHVFRERDWYHDKIIKKVSKISDEWILKSIHNFIVGMTKEGN